MLQFDDVEVVIWAKTAFSTMVELAATASNALRQDQFLFVALIKASYDLTDGWRSQHSGHN